MAKNDTPTLSEIAQQLTEGLRRTAIRPSISGYRAYDHQVPFHRSSKQGRLFLGGNRAGKTVAGGAEMVQRLVGKHLYNEVKRPPIKARAIATDLELGLKKIVMPEIARWVPPSQLKNGSWEDSFDKQSRTLTLNNGSFLEFMSYEQEVQRFAGTSRDCVWFDEEPPEDIFNENMLRLLDVSGCYWLTMTPLFEMSWTFDRLYEPGLLGSPDIDVFQVNTEDNPGINPSEIDVLLSGMSDEEKDARKHGRYFSQTGGIYASEFRPHHVIPSIVDSDEWPIFRDRWGHFGMLDHGYSNPTAFLLGCYNEEGDVIIYAEHYQSKLLVKENAEKILQLIESLKLTNYIEYIVADPSIRNKEPIAGSSIHAEYSDNGLSLGLANNDVHSGILRVKSRLKMLNEHGAPKLRITQNCENLLREFPRYRWDKFASSKIAAKNNLKEQPVKKDDHALDALRYGIVSRPTLEGELDIKPGNELNAPVAINPDEPFVDRDFNGSSGFDHEFLDPQMGSDW